MFERQHDNTLSIRIRIDAQWSAVGRSHSLCSSVSVCLSLDEWNVSLPAPLDDFLPVATSIYRRCRSLSLEAQNPRHPNQTSVFTVLKKLNSCFFSSPLRSVRLFQQLCVWSCESATETEARETVAEFCSCEDKKWIDGENRNRSDVPSVRVLDPTLRCDGDESVSKVDCCTF